MRLRKALGSPKLAAWLIGALLVLSVVSVIVPQSPTLGTSTVAAWVKAEPWLAKPAIALGLTRVFYSWPYYLVSLALAVNLSFCTWNRAVSRARASAPTLGTPPDDASPVSTALDQGSAVAALRAAMRGFEVFAADGGVVCGSGRRGFAGSVVMHTGLIVCVLAGIATGLTRFEGTIVLTEGIETPDVAGSYVDAMRIPRIGDPFTRARLTLEKMEFEYAGHEVTDSRAHMRVVERDAGSPRTYVARVNYPLRVGAKSFLLKASGLSAGIRVTDPSGTVLPDAMINLGRYEPEGYADEASFGPLRLGLLAVPDADAPRGALVAQRYVLVKPAVIVSATVDGARALSGETVLPGASVTAAGWRVDVLEVRRWTSFSARVDWGIYLAYVGFALVVFGSLTRLLDPDRTVRVRLGDGRALVWARARWGPAMAATAARRAVRALGGELPDGGKELGR